MSRQVMIIDMDRCVGCGACVIACQEEWNLPEGVFRNWVRPLFPVSSSSGSSGTVFTHYVGMCNHCRKAPCLDACPTGATYRDEQGRIKVDPEACIGCGYCVEACPYSARLIREDLYRVEKCDLCADRVDSGLQPACVDTCPAAARIFGDLDHPNGEATRHLLNKKTRRLETDEVATEPQLFYSGKNKLLDRIFTAYPPDPTRTRPPVQGRILEQVIRPGFFCLLGLAFLGEGIAFFRQRVKRKHDLSAKAARQSDEAEAEAEGAAKAEAEAAEAPMLRLHDTPIIWLHWFNALVWLLQILTGFALLGSSSYRVTPGFFNDAMLTLFGSSGTLLRFHLILGTLWMAVLLGYGLLGFRRYLIAFLRDLVIHPTDISWLVATTKSFILRSKEKLPDQGRYNAGQKLFGMVVAAGTVLVIASGLVMWLLPGSGSLMQWAIPLHFLAAAMVVVGLVVHIYMTTFVPAERPILFSMFHGRIPQSYAREHKRFWWQSQKHAPASDHGPAHTPGPDKQVSRHRRDAH